MTNSCDEHAIWCHEGDLYCIKILRVAYSANGETHILLSELLHNMTKRKVSEVLCSGLLSIIETDEKCVFSLTVTCCDTELYLEPKMVLTAGIRDQSQYRGREACSSKSS